MIAERKFEIRCLIDGKHLVESVIFKSAAAVRLEKVPASVALKLRRIVVAALEVAVAEAQPEETSGEQDGIDYKCRQELDGPSVASIAEIQPTEHPPADKHRHQQHPEEQRQDRVGLHDVPDYFVGVHQIVNGDEVVADSELIPEDALRDDVENHQEYVEPHGEQKPRLAPTFSDVRNEQPQAESAKQKDRERSRYRRNDGTIFSEYVGWQE